ncbi:MAG: LacI family DNA-binding transcriptional regulator [Tyzzerella sp.]|nr:LacI family DNA-binding transcriptional regulator [Tyzzerella sp.]
MSVTLKDIANELNLSINAVSRGLRNMPDIGPDTTKLIQETALKLGYRKNFAASYIKTRKSMMLGIIITDICNPLYSSIYKGIEHICANTDYALMLGNSNENPEEEIAIIDNMLSRGIDGIFLVPSMKNSDVLLRLKESKIPYIFLQRNFADITIPYIYSDDYKGGYLAAEHLYQQGHRSFLYLAPPLYISSAKERFDGFVAFLQEQGLPKECVEIVRSDATRVGSYRAMNKWLKKQGNLNCLSATAIFCFSDYVAYGVYPALAKHGLRIPNDISVIGYDNTEYSDIISPPLTTIDMQPYKIGRKAAQLMLTMMDNPNIHEEPVKVFITPKLIQRSSTGIPKKF